MLRKICNTCNRKTRHNKSGQCINCVTNKSKIQSDVVSV